MQGTWLRQTKARNPEQLSLETHLQKEQLESMYSDLSNPESYSPVTELQCCLNQTLSFSQVSFFEMTLLLSIIFSEKYTDFTARRFLNTFPSK